MNRVRHTSYTYECGCKASGGPDLPMYCPNHPPVGIDEGWTDGLSSLSIAAQQQETKRLRQGLDAQCSMTMTGLPEHLKSSAAQPVGYPTTGGTPGVCGNSLGSSNLASLFDEIPRDGPPGGKDTGFKPQVWTGAFQSFPLALAEVARCTTDGLRAPGHTLHRWKEVPDGFKVYSEAHARHVLREAQAMHPDEEFEEVVTVAWNALARLEHLCQDRDRGMGSEG